MDFGCSCHMRLKNEYFESLELVEFGGVHFEDGKACKVQGMVRFFYMM